MIEIDITQPLPIELNIEKPNGEMLEQDVEYEWMTKFCPESCQFGHFYTDFSMPFKSQAVRRKRRKERVKWKSKAVDVQVVPRLGEMVDKGEQVQIDTSKHKGLIDYEVLAATANAPLRIQEDH